MDKKGLIIECRYEIIDRLGKGGMGQVYLAKDNKGNLYAIKEVVVPDSDINGTSLKFLNREAHILQVTEHPGLPKFYERIEYNGCHYMVMEYIKGKTLEEIIESSHKPLEEHGVLVCAIELCEIFFYLHTFAEPIIYRDLKPANIIITEDEKVRIIDFGVARYYDPSKSSDTIRLGTPGYAAPEQYGNKRQSTPQSDIYALGIILHQLLTKHDPSLEPFKLPKIRTLNPDVSEELEMIITRAIQYHPKDRYLDMGLFRDELIGYYEDKYGPFSRTPYTKQLPYTGKSNIVSKSSKMIKRIAEMFPDERKGVFIFSMRNYCMVQN